MPNGVDKNLRRLLMTCALYRRRFGEWPSQARMHSVILHDLACALDEREFQKLATHLQLRTRDSMGISVGGRGVVQYDEVQPERPDDDAVRLAEQWLDVQARRDAH